ncbi:MAG: pyridoxal phosphate-dependent aminotransferase [Chitinophagales bacterium]|nr:pyridoxal phosphate-dependent aminotransferase [Chitinophagales bacterium]
MPKISNKGDNMPSSPIRKLVPYADKARKQGKHVFHLNIGQPDLPTPDVFWKAISEESGSTLSYCPSNGYEFYREKFAKYYREFVGIKDVDADNFIITTGGSEALIFSIFSTLDAGSEIIIPEPMYANYIGFCSSGNINIKPIITSIEKNYALPEIAEFEHAITENTKAILICNPNNPTGYLYTKEELERLKDIVLKHDLFLFVDEVYREFTYGGEFYSILNFEELKDHVIVIDSISKRFSACGARVGAIVSRNQEVLDTCLKFAQARLSPPSLGQIGGAALFDLGKDYYDSVKEEFSARRDFLVGRLLNMEGVLCPQPGGAFYLLVKLDVDNTDKFCQWLLESFEYEGSTVMLAPGSGFYSTPGLGQYEARIAYVLKEEDLAKAMDCLENAIKEYKTNVMTSDSVFDQTLS